MQHLPAKQSFKTTAWVLKRRELSILSVGLLIGLSFLVLPILASWFARIAVSSLVIIGAVVYTFYQPQPGRTIEQVVFDWLSFRNRKRRYMRGGTYLDHGIRITHVQAKPQAAPRMFDFSLRLPGEWRPSNSELVMMAVSLFSFIVFSAWIGTGGIEQMQRIISGIGAL